MTTLAPPVEPALGPTHARAAPRVDRRRESVRRLATGGALLGAIAALTTVRDLWAAESLQLGLLLVVPGLLLLDAVRVPRAAVRGFPAYVPAASITVLFASGLAADLLGPRLGIHRPLAPGPLLTAVMLVCGGLLVARPTGPNLGLLGPWCAAVCSRRAWPLVLPCAAAAGAIELNQDHGGGLAIVAALAALSVLTLATVRSSRIDGAQLSFILYGVGLAAIWSLSLRGHYPYGFDIAQEAHDAAATVRAGVWHAAHAHDAYGAMLSVTLLPATLHVLSGASVDALLKVVYPALFALFPVGVFALASRHLRPWYAFAAGAFVLAQGFLVQSIPTVSRQEIGLLVFVALVAAVLETGARRRWQLPLIGLLSLTLVLSHYTSAYVAIVLFAAAVLLELPRSARARAPRATLAIVTALVTTTVAALVWYAPVTRSASNLQAFVTSVETHGIELLPNARGHDAISSYLFGNTSSRISAREYQDEVASRYRLQRPFVQPLPAARDPAYALQNATEPGDAVRLPAAKLALGNIQVLAEQLANLLAAAGALGMVVLSRRRVSPLQRVVGALGCGTLAVLALSRLSGTFASDYNQERSFVQALVLLAPALGWTLQALSRDRVRPRRLIVGGFCALAAISFSATLGLSQLVVGGGTSVRFANAGEDYERLYTTAPELAAARWISLAPHGALVYADRYGQLRLLEATGRSSGVLGDVTPLTLNRNAWVYASTSNLQWGRARAQLDNRYVLYRWPSAFLERNFNLVYDDGCSEVYRR